MDTAKTTALSVIAGTTILLAVLVGVFILAFHGTVTGGAALTVVGIIVGIAGGAFSVQAGITAGTKATTAATTAVQTTTPAAK